MKKIIALIIALVTILCCAATMASASEYVGGRDTSLLNPAWVNTQDGKRLNLRASVNGTILTRLDTGTKIWILDFVNGGEWAEVMLQNGKTGYVMTKFLQEGKPGKYDLTEREDNFVTIANPYTVTAKALNNKTTQSVGLRTKASKSSKAIRRLNAGDKLTVLAVGNTWMKVKDVKTGKTGYVAKDYVRF
ncbi:MAG: SH3 domain-containing protein [Clostridia bacterium]|nr:SH3 domain-containing protein [Clostridia bacterium]